jgi:hypothetical protein
MDNTRWQKREPWTVVDPDFKREWVFPHALQYYVVRSKASGLWSICDRNTDLAVPTTESKTREQAIRRFYTWCERPLPKGEKLHKLGIKIAHQGETG